MSKQFKKILALTDSGAKDLTKASLLNLILSLIKMLPLMLAMILFDELILGNHHSEIFYIVVSLAVFLAIIVTLSIEYNATFNATYSESANLRIELITMLKGLPLSYFSKHELSDLSQVIMNDVAAMEHAVSHAIPSIVAFSIFFPLISIAMLIGNFKLGMALVLPMFLSIIFLLLSKSYSTRILNKHYIQLRENSDRFQESIELQQEIKSFNLKEVKREELNEMIDSSEKLQLGIELRLGVLVTISSLLSQMALPITILAGIALYNVGEVNLVYLVGYILAAIKIKEAVDAIELNLGEVFYINDMVERIKDIKETKVQEGENFDISSYNITLEDVEFSYNDDTKVLKGVSFEAIQNEVTALVGMSGCGKTSLLRLVSRLYDYDAGSINIGGVDVKKMSTELLYKMVSIVFQDVTLFDTTVMENIRIGKSLATDEEVISAAKEANCHEFINRLPQGYNTFIGENGAMLSGGERQRLSIARAFLKNSPIIILDEIAASLDVQNEKKIQESLNKLTRNKTVIIISHRLKSIENVDKIVVIDGGVVEAVGTHMELINSSPIYNNLVEKSKLADAFRY